VARQINRLSPAHVLRAKPGLHADGGGLYLQVSESKTTRAIEAKYSKSWIFRYRRDKRERDMGLGSLKTISLKEARDSAEQCRKLLLEGKDPIEVREAERAAEHAKKQTATTIAPAFERCAIAYMAAHESGRRNAKHRQQWTNTLATYAYPTIGQLPVDAIDTGLVMQVLMPIWTEKNETAGRVRGRIEKILDWARVKGHRSGDNPARWEGHLEFLLAKRSKVRKARHHPALPWAQIAEFMAELRHQEGLAAKCLEFAILTAARSGEARGVPWDGEINTADKLWTVPAHRMKGDKEHSVPLTEPALAIIDYMREIRQNEYVFPGDHTDEPLSGHGADGNHQAHERSACERRRAAVGRSNAGRAGSGPAWLPQHVSRLGR
jgi:integrase